MVDDSPCKTLVFPSELRAKELLYVPANRSFAKNTDWDLLVSPREQPLYPFGIVPLVSTYGISSYIYHKNQPNVGIYIYTIHGSCGSTFPPKKFPKILALHSLWDVSCRDDHIPGWKFEHKSRNKKLGGSSHDLDTWLIAMVSFSSPKKRVVCTSKWPFNPWFIINRGEPNHLY